MKYQAYLMSHGGKLREINQDNYYLQGEYRKDDHRFCSFYHEKSSNNLLAAVFDGMGGEKLGEVASRIAAEYMKKEHRMQGRVDMNQFAEGANQEILQCSGKDVVGTTYVAVSITDNIVSYSNIGDSTGYLLRDGHLEKITKDHTLVQELIDNGIISPEEAKVHPKRHVLLQCLGMKDHEYEIIPEAYQAKPLEARKGDQYLLCSDGLTDMLTDVEIEMILNTNWDLKKKTETLMEQALRNGGKDNITVLLIQSK